MEKKTNYFRHEWEIGQWFGSLTPYERCKVRDFILKQGPKLYVFEKSDEEGTL
jgi:hypothetical protein